LLTCTSDEEWEKEATKSKLGKGAKTFSPFRREAQPKCKKRVISCVPELSKGCEFSGPTEKQKYYCKVVGESPKMELRKRRKRRGALKKFRCQEEVTEEIKRLEAIFQRF